MPRKQPTKKPQKTLRRKQAKLPKKLLAVAVASNLLFVACLVWFFAFRSTQPFTLTVHSASLTSQPVAIYQPPTGHAYLVLDVTIAHPSKQPLWLTPVVQSYVTAAGSATRYYMAPYALENPFDAEVYKPRVKASGELSYLVPANAQHLSWCYYIGNTTVCKPLNLH